MKYTFYLIAVLLIMSGSVSLASLVLRYDYGILSRQPGAAWSDILLFVVGWFLAALMLRLVISKGKQN